MADRFYLIGIALAGILLCSRADAVPSDQPQAETFLTDCSAAPIKAECQSMQKDWVKWYSLAFDGDYTGQYNTATQLAHGGSGMLVKNSELACAWFGVIVGRQDDRVQKRDFDNFSLFCNQRRIPALVLMQSRLKAEELFRTIFKRDLPRIARDLYPG